MIDAVCESRREVEGLDEEVLEDIVVFVAAVVAVIIESRSDNDFAFDVGDFELSLTPERADTLILPAPPRPDECYRRK